MSNPENPQETDDTSSAPDDKSSLLDQIIKTSQEEKISFAALEQNTPSDTTKPVTSWTDIITKKRSRDPLTVWTVFKLIGTLLLIAVIFFWSFLAYVVFNPDQAAFFVNIFGISPDDIKDLLKKLINGSFWITVLVFSIIWISSLFRAIWSPKEQKRRKLTNWLLASVIGIILFSILAFWAYLFNIINQNDYANPGGDVTIYDNDLFVHNDSIKYSRISTTRNLVGPITLRYDLSTNAKTVAKKNLFSIESYEINFDGANCSNNQSEISWSNPLSDQWIICTFDQVRTYNIRGTYTGKDRMGEPETIIIPLETVEIKWLLDINTNTNTNGKKVITINASKIKNLGTPRWLYDLPWSTEQSKSSITETVSSTPLIVCLMIMSTSCDRYFIIADNEKNTVDGSIVFELDSTNTLGVTMSLTGTDINNNEIVDINWVEKDWSRLCQWASPKCEYAFLWYGEKEIVATILLANTKSYTIEGSIILNPPLTVIRHARVTDKSNNLLNPPNTFDSSVNAYVIEDLSLPMEITLDARDVILENPGYKIQSIKWTISYGDTVEEKIWDKVNYEIPRTARYVIKGIYTFEKTIATTDAKTRTTEDTIILDLEKKIIDPIFRIQQSSDYIPSKVTVDASSSTSKNGKLQKFIFDFGEDRPLAEGDAIQTYEYHTAGEKKITLKVIDENNEQATISKYIVLKDTPKTIEFSTSMSPGVINTPVDFIADGTTGQIEEWIWNFWDNTPIAKWYDPTHIFKKSWTYNVTLTVRYIDGTERFTQQPFIVQDTLE